MVAVIENTYLGQGMGPASLAFRVGKNRQRKGFVARRAGDVQSWQPVRYYERKALEWQNTYRRSRDEHSTRMRQEALLVDVLGADQGGEGGDRDGESPRELWRAKKRGVNAWTPESGGSKQELVRQLWAAYGKLWRQHVRCSSIIGFWAVCRLSMSIVMMAVIVDSDISVVPVSPAACGPRLGSWRGGRGKKKCVKRATGTVRGPSRRAMSWGGGFWGSQKRSGIFL